MEFKEFKQQLQGNFAKITGDVTHAFEVNLDKDELWNLYLDSFPEGTNKVYRERREYDCSCCKNFIRNVGNVVTIKDNNVSTVWDFETVDDKFAPVVQALSEFVKSKAIKDVWVNKEKHYGVDKNFEKLTTGEVQEWHHFYLDIPQQLVTRSNKSEAELTGELRDTRNVFKRSLDEISVDALETVLELISQNSLYKGEEWKSVLTEFLKYKKQYIKLKESDKDNYAWEQSVKVGAVIGRIRNHSMGTLLINISEGMDLNTAVKKYENIVAGENYKRPKPIFTQKMLDDAKKTIVELGYEKSLPRRFATLEDITINNILFSNKDSAKRILGLDVFDELSAKIPLNTMKFDKVEEISIEDFIKNVLPLVKELEVLFENKHSKNLVSLIAPKDKESKTMFKWNNNFSWAYTGNITDSSMKENVKSAGGKIDGVLRFSIQWNDGNELNENDFDAHCIEPDNNRIYYGDKKSYRTGGELDVDIIHPQKNKPAVENIVWTSKSKMINGDYTFLVNNFSNRGGRTGFKAEIEFDGEIHTFEYNKELRSKQNVTVAVVHFDGVNFTIKDMIQSNVSSKEVWGLNTNQFVPVSVVSYSPNYWDEQNGIGNKHFMFFLKDCINETRPNAFFNEFMNGELYPAHKKVIEALGSTLKVEDSDDQLSGLGFSSTQRNELVVKVKGQSERVLKIKF